MIFLGCALVWSKEKRLQARKHVPSRYAVGIEIRAGHHLKFRDDVAFPEAIDTESLYAAQLQ
ncbi:hypothetical protein D3C71_876140 [compost metagenome]